MESLLIMIWEWDSFKNTESRFENITLKGYTAEYDAVLREVQNMLDCVPRIGIDFYLFPIEPGISTRALSSWINDFNLSCSSAFTMGIIQMYEWTIYKSCDIVNNINFEDDSKTIDLCNTAGRGASTITMHDLNGDFDPNKNGRLGFVVTDESKMTTFAGGAGCTPIMDTCAQFCQETYL